jgi:hypothetical protein
LACAAKALQVQIVTRMREFGMTPVLAGFAGHVPAALETHFPNSNFTHSSDWCGFEPQYGSDTLLEATDALFQTLGAAMNKATLEDYGDPTGQETPIFNADMYNEMEPNSSNLTYLADCNSAVYSAMTAANPASVYMMQAWLFHESFWTYDRVKAFLGGVPIGSMIILDLNSEDGPVWNVYVEARASSGGLLAECAARQQASAFSRPPSFPIPPPLIDMTPSLATAGCGAVSLPTAGGAASTATWTPWRRAPTAT